MSMQKASPPGGSTGGYQAEVTAMAAVHHAGSNTMRWEPTTTAGLPNLDYLDVGVAAA